MFDSLIIDEDTSIQSNLSSIPPVAPSPKSKTLVDCVCKLAYSQSTSLILACQSPNWSKGSKSWPLLSKPGFEIITTPENFGEIIEALDKNNYDVEGDIGLVPINTVKISKDESKSIIKLLEILEDHEDIQKLYSNFEVS